MRARTLVTDRLYFGIDPMSLRTATARVYTRVVGLPRERARVSARNLRQDFGIGDTTAGQMLIDEFVSEGLLDPPNELQSDYGLKERFLELAFARVVEPLPRDRARQLLGKACELAARINSEWTRNPLEIEVVAPFGSYMSRDRQLAELSLGVVVRPRLASRRARWGKIAPKSEGAHDIRSALRELSSFIHVRLVSNKERLPRPFAVAFQDESPLVLDDR
ncbi:MAG TPA: hypothetical protein VFF44_03045 [Casimicrobiaceae bacterium]|nr:hypothetical protein [Casimicrobiaceae bacterium]